MILFEESVLLIEQNANMALKVADRGYVMETGRITMEGTGLELLENELEAVSHRPYNSGFYFGELVHNHFNDGLYHYSCTFAGTALNDVKDGVLKIRQRNYFEVGDTLEVLSPSSLGLSFKVEKITNESGEDVQSACHPLETLYINCPVDVKKDDILRARCKEKV